MNPTYAMDLEGGQVFEVDREARVIRGLLVPYGPTGKSRGKTFRFSKDSLVWADPSRVKMWIQHDSTTAVGHAFELEHRLTGTDKPGLYGAIKVARGPAGDHALSMAEDKVWDGFSVGLGEGGEYIDRGGILHPVGVPLLEVSLTPAPSFSDARVHSVAASAVPNERNTMTDTPTVETPTETVAEFSAAQTGALQTMVADAIAAGFADLRNPQGGPEVVDPTANGGAQVVEELPYRFDGIRGAHSMTDDIKAAYFSGDGEARQRLETFIEEAFAVTAANVSSLNPTQNRPELYVPNLSFTRPLWDLVSTGTIEDKTPFTVPKFSSASGLVAAHTEGTEPTPGAFAATSQTVSPAPMSGKIEINREVWDQGGSPQADGIIWGEMLNAYYEMIEANIKTVLASTATAELNLGSVVDQPLVAAITGYLAGLQFVRGGNRFTAFASDSKLFPALVNAKDGANRPLLPVTGPMNAQGTVDGPFDRVQIGAQSIRAAWALAQGANTRSYNFVPSSVWYWASAPKRFTFEYQVKSIDMAIWGYGGGAILRDSDVKPIDYDVSDA